MFAVEWERGRITWFVDDTQYQSFNLQSLPGGVRWVFDHEFFVILNVAVGGNFVGAPNENTQFPRSMLVDYVRVYRGES